VERWLVAAAAVLLVGVVGYQAVRGSGGDSGEGAAANPDPVVLGFLPSQRANEIVPDARRLGEFLAERLGRRIEVLVPTAYEPLIEGFRFGHVHAAFLDGGPAWIAHRRTGAQVLLAEVKEGRTHYYAEAFVRSDSPLSGLEEVVGARVAFTSRTGSSGFLMPIGTLIGEGVIRPAGPELTDLEAALRRTFASTIEAGGYRQALQALLEERVDVAFGAHDAPVRFLPAEQQERIRTLHRFGRIPSHAVVVSGQLSAELKAGLRDALLELNRPEHLPLLRAIYGVDGLVATDTETHLGDFGRAISALPGMERTLLARENP
jgi:phosphonate transport system substrate-binding protein